MADPWQPGAWAPGAWQPGAWDNGGGGEPHCTVDVVEEGDALVCTATAARAPARRTAPVVGGGGFVPRRSNKAWLRALLPSGFIFNHQQSIEPFARLATVKCREQGDTCSAGVAVTGRSRAARDEDVLLLRAA